MTLCRPAKRAERASTPKSNHCSPLARSVQGAQMTNPSVAWLTHTRTHIYKHMHKKLLCDIRLETRVTHANETGPASSWQHSDILHSSTSLQKPKSFSPPSPVIVTLMERRSGNHLFSHTVRRTHNYSSHVCLSCSWKKPLAHKLQYCIWHLTLAIKKKTTHLQGHKVAFNPE